MPCPRCGYDLTSVNAATCPNCGLQLTQQPPAQQPGYPPTGYPAAPSAPGYSQPPYQPLSEQPPTYGAPQGYPTTPGYPQNPVPGYPTGAPPSVPLAPGQGFSQPYYTQPGMPPTPFGQPPKRNNGLVIGIILALVVIVGGAVAIALSHGGTSTAATGTPTLTSTTGPTPTPTEAALYQESFASQPDGWSEDSNCFFGSGGYHITNGFFCFAPIGEQADVDISVDVKQITGDTTLPYGIGFRRPGQGEHYEFDIDSNGKWVFFSCDPSTCTTIVDYTANSAIKGGLNTSNTLRVSAKGTHFDFFVNGTKVGQADDSTYTSGDLGLIVGDDSMECVFSNMVVTRPN